MVAIASEHSSKMSWMAEARLQFHTDTRGQQLMSHISANRFFRAVHSKDNSLILLRHDVIASLCDPKLPAFKNNNNNNNETVIISAYTCEFCGRKKIICFRFITVSKYLGNN